MGVAFGAVWPCVLGFGGAGCGWELGSGAGLLLGSGSGKVGRVPR